MTNQTTSAKLPFSFYQENAKRAYHSAKAIYNKGRVRSRKNWALALKEAWSELRAEKYLQIGSIVFYKESTNAFTKSVNNEIRHANILPIENYTAYTAWSAKHKGLFMTIDADKLKKTGDPKASIISFYAHNIIY